MCSCTPDSDSDLGCDYAYACCSLRFCLLQNTPRSGKIVATRPSALVYCFAYAHHAVDRRFFQASPPISPVSDIVGEFDFRRDVLTFLSTKGGRYSPPRGKIPCLSSVFPHFLNSPTIS